MPITIILLATIIYPFPADAYLDPGTGSMVLHLVVGAIAGGLMVIKVYWYKFKSLFTRPETNGEGVDPKQ